MIAEILPTVSECISYGLPAFKHNGTVIGGFGATKKHCSYYPFSGSTLKTLKSDLLKYKQTKSALHFPLDKPLSTKIIKQLIMTRMAEIQNSVETVSFFDLPGYSLEGYDYKGMFAWFSFKAPFVRLHVRPEALANHKTELAKYFKTKAIISFPAEESIPKSLLTILHPLMHLIMKMSD